MKKLSLLFIPFFIFNLSYSQNQVEGDSFEIKSVIMNSNEITSVFFNYGSFSKPNYLSNIADFVWKELGYMYEFGPLVVAEVINENGDTLHIVDDSFILPTQGSYSPDGTLKWGWLPRTGYANPNQDEIATNNNLNSWPSNWISWPGEFGNGVVIGLNEAYYVMDDFTNAKFPYYPFPTDTTNRGLGLKTEVRVYQFGGALKDAMIIKYKITNESPKNLDKVYFGFHGDPHIGGSLDYFDDMVKLIGPNGPSGYPNHYQARNTIYMWDQDGIGFGEKKTGYLSFKFLDTPGDKDLTSFHAAPYTNDLPNVPKNSELMWQWLSDGIDSLSAENYSPGDQIINFGTGSFSLAAGESKEISLAIFLSKNFEDMLNDAVVINFLSSWPLAESQPGSSGGDPNYSIEINSPVGVQNGIIPISYQYNGNDPNAKLYIDYSSDRGRNWFPLAWDLPIDSNYEWNTLNYNDGVNYLLRIIAYNPSLDNQYFYNVADNRFTINNPGNAQPELELNLSFEDSVINYSPVAIRWTAEDADNQNLNIKIEYSFNPAGPYFQVLNENYAAGNFIYNWDVSNIPNADKIYLKITASDGSKDTSLISKSFSIDYELESYLTNNFLQIQGKSTPDFIIHVVDTNQVTDNTYQISFTVEGDSSKKMSINNYTTNTPLINNYPLFQGTSTPVFDGIKLTIIDHQTEINLNKSKFNRDELNSFVEFLFPPEIGTPKIRTEEDWIIAFNSLDTSSNGNYIYPGDTVLSHLSHTIITPFRIVILNSTQKATYRIYESRISTRNNGRWDPLEPIILQPTGETGPITTYQVNFSFSSILPHSGDTLKIVTYKTITSNDIFRFAVDSVEILNAVGGNESQPHNYYLSQNYPNPFNPSTTIEYYIPKDGLVTLKIYDILGREIETLANEYKNNGRYKVEFNGLNLATGIYFYKINVNDFNEVKKMMLIK